MVRQPLMSGLPLALLLACSACAPAGERTAAAPVATPAAAPTAQPSSPDRGLPGLPEASGSAHAGGRHGALPEPARRVLQQLKCDVAGAHDALVVSIPGQQGEADVMVTDQSGPRFRYWLRSFSGGGGKTGYLVQLKGCPASTTGMRAYIAEATGPLQDVTGALLAQASLPDDTALAAYQDKGAGELFAFTGQLDKVPVLRWVLEADPDQPLGEDARTFDHGNAVHAGFLRWNQDHFEVTQTLPAALWPCNDGPLLPCTGDRFVIGR